MAKKWRSKKTKGGKTIRFPVGVKKSASKSTHKASILKPKVPEKIVRKTMSIEDFKEGYVYGHYPGLTGYGYQAEMITKDEAREVMNDILKDVVRIEDHGHSPLLIMKDGRELWATDTDDFPQPTAEAWEGDESEEW